VREWTAPLPVAMSVPSDDGRLAGSEGILGHLRQNQRADLQALCSGTALLSLRQPPSSAHPRENTAAVPGQAGLAATPGTSQWGPAQPPYGAAPQQPQYGYPQPGQYDQVGLCVLRSRFCVLCVRAWSLVF
jgi:hypothetical protein